MNWPALFTLAAVVLVSTNAGADDGALSGEQGPDAPAVVLELPRCEPEPLRLQALQDILRVELWNDGLTRLTTVRGTAVEPEAGCLRVRVRLEPCSPEVHRAVVRAEVVGLDEHVQRSVVLSEVPTAARPRALALAVAELVRTLRERLAAKASPSPASPATPGAAPQPSLHLAPWTAPEPVALSDTSEAPYGAVLADGRIYDGRGEPVLGLRVVGSTVTGEGSPVRVRLDAGVHGARAQRALGDVQVWLATGALGASWFVSGDVPFELGPRFELGWARAEGMPDAAGVQGDQRGVVVAMGLLTATLRAAVRRRTWLTMEAEVGTVLWGLEPLADGNVVQAVDGLALGLRIGVAGASL